MTNLTELADLAGGDKLPTFKFKRINDAVKGTVLRSSIVETTDNFKGTKKKSLVLDIEIVQARGGIVTNVRDDDGLDRVEVSDHQPGEKVTVWLNPGFGIGAIKDALTAGGAAAIENGATVKIKLVEKRDVGKESPANVFEAEYTAPAPSTVGVSDL